MAASGMKTIPGWVLAWLLISGVICTWDALFILLRPHTMPGGRWHAIWSPYALYVTVDQRYNDLNDSYVIAQSTLNLVEVFINFVVLALHFARSRHAQPLAFCVSVMTFWKTVLYFLMFTSFVGGDKYRKDNTLTQEILLLYIPNGVWLLVPFLVMATLWNFTTDAHASPSLAASSSQYSRSAIHVSMETDARRRTRSSFKKSA